MLLDESRLFSRDSGWIDEPGKPLMFGVKRTSAEVSIIAVSRPIVAESIASWLRSWAVKSFEPVRVTGGPDQLRASGMILASVGSATLDQPDLIVPLRSRFGSFELASWDVRQAVVHYHSATLAVAAALAALIGVLGFVVFLAQWRHHAIAARRVSFVNRVSNELRTPLTNILLNTDLASELAEDDPAESARRLELVRIEARRLGRLIDNVLPFSRSEEGRMEIRPNTCIPAEIVAGVIDSFLASRTPGRAGRSLHRSLTARNQHSRPAPSAHRTGRRSQHDPQPLLGARPFPRVPHARSAYRQAPQTDRDRPRPTAD